MRLLLLLLLLCGCKTSQKSDWRPRLGKTPVAEAVTRARFLVPDPPQPAAVIVPTEILLPFQVRVAAWRIHDGGGFHAAMSDSRLVVWNDNNQIAVLPLSNWTNEWSETDFAIAGSTLVLVSQGHTPGVTPNVAQEYALSGWQNGLPGFAVLVTNLNWSTGAARGAWALATSAGGIVAVTARHESPIHHDIIYRSPAGRWSTYESVHPETFWASHHLDLLQGNDGRIYILTVKDGAGKLTAARWVEHDGGLAFVDFDGGFVPQGKSYSLDREFAWPMLAGTNASWQADYGSTNGCWFRVAHPVIVGLDIKPPAARPKILSHQLSGQNIWLDWRAEPGGIYQPQASEDLVHWQNLIVWRWVESPGKISIGAANPFYNFATGSPFKTALFLSVRNVNYKVNQIATLPDWVERYFARTPLVRTASGLSYFVSPFDANCDMSRTYYRALGQSSAVEAPIDYSLVSLGHGWSVIQRGANFYLKRLT